MGIEWKDNGKYAENAKRLAEAMKKKDEPKVFRTCCVCGRMDAEERMAHVGDEAFKCIRCVRGKHGA